MSWRGADAHEELTGERVAGRIETGCFRSSPFDFQPHDFPALTLGNDLKRPAAHFAIGCEALELQAGVEGDLGGLAAERTLDRFGDFHPIAYRRGEIVQTRERGAPARRAGVPGVAKGALRHQRAES